jgi:hypothetical protein
LLGSIAQRGIKISASGQKQAIAAQQSMSAYPRKQALISDSECPLCFNVREYDNQKNEIA